MRMLMRLIWSCPYSGDVYVEVEIYRIQTRCCVNVDTSASLLGVSGIDLYALELCLLLGGLDWLSLRDSLSEWVLRKCLRVWCLEEDCALWCLLLLPPLGGLLGASLISAGRILAASIVF